MGQGATIFDWNQNINIQYCYAGSYFAAYKCSLTGITGSMIASRLEYSNLVLIDNGASIIPMLGEFGDDLSIAIWDSVFYGETDAKECPAKDACSQYGVDLQGPGAPSLSHKVYCY